MQTISLTKGAKVLVDDSDYEKYSGLKWYLSNTGYAVRRGKIDGRTKTTYLHRLINKTPSCLFTDHINRKRLDNRKNNLRSVTWEENRNNSSGHKDNKLKEHHIDFMKSTSLFRVRFQEFKQIVHQTYHKTLGDAIISRDSFSWQIQR